MNKLLSRITPARLAVLFPDEASYTRPPVLTRRNDSTFDTDNPPALAHYLQTHGYTLHARRAPIEYARLQRGAVVVVLYNSGAAVAQGAQPELATSLLAALCAENGSLL